MLKKSAHTNQDQMNYLSKEVANEIQDIYKKLYLDKLHGENPEVILFSHFGELNQKKTEYILPLINDLILENGIKRKIMKRISSVMVENLQNVAIHGAKDINGNQNSLLIVSRKEDAIRVTTGNVILDEDKSSLDFKLSNINKLSKEEVRRLYIETLCNEDFSLKGGAGLGLLTMAKKAAAPLKYSIQSIGHGHSYFVIQYDVKVIEDIKDEI